MDRPLENFETWITKDMLRKGEDYWINDCVANLAQEEDTWAADVYGTEEYTVEVIVNNGQVADWHCDCPYDYGPICKHVIAVLFEVREEMPIEKLEEDKPTKSTVNHKTSKTKSDDPIQEIIEKLNEKELRKLLTYLAKRQDDVRAHLLSKYTHLIEVVSKKQFENLVKSHIDACSSGGFLEYRDADRLGDQLCALLDNTDDNNPMAMVYLCEAIIGQLAQAYQYADDSSGSMGGAMENAFQALYNIADEDNEYPPEVVQYVFEYAIKESNKKEYQGWDWPSNFRSLACDAIRSKAQAKQMMKMLEQSIEMNKNEKYKDYEIEQAQRLKLYLIEEYNSKSEATKFLNKNLHYSSFRKIAIERAMKAERYEEVKRLAEEGVVWDTQTGYAGLVNQWKNWLVKVADKIGDQTSLVKLNEELFFNRGEMQYYQELKKIIPKTEFKKKVEFYIQHFRNNANTYRKGAYNSQVAKILIAENRLEDLMTEIKRSPSLYILDEYFDLLGKSYKKDFVNFYSQLVQIQMERGSGRGTYQKCCHYIDKMILLGGLEEAKVIVQGWRKQYPRRPAMLDELRKYKW